jgi:Zn-dependent protease with chaperone function
MGESQRKLGWVAIRSRIHVFFLIEIAGVWAWWSFRDVASNLSLWCALVASIGTVHWVCYRWDRTFLGRRWTPSDLIRLTFWRTICTTIALILVALAFEGFDEHKLSGLIWLVAAGIVAMVGTVRLRLAEGMRLQEVKSGAAYKRAFALAKEMRTTLEHVYVVPAGRGHITNAFGLGQSIALTDNYGKFLHGPQLDFVICHELAHVKGRHGRKKILMTVSVYASLGILSLILPQSVIPFRPALNFGLMLGPVLSFYYLSRHFEYVADRAAVKLTRDPTAGINALEGLYDIREVPKDCGSIVELFMTHPSFTRRARAIGEAGTLSEHQDSDAIHDAQA